MSLNFSDLKFIESGNPRMMCHHWALGVITDEDMFERFIKFFYYYYQVRFNNIKTGDLALFLRWNPFKKRARHSAIVFKKGTNIENTVIHSKLSNLGIYECQIQDLKELYGSKIKFFRKK